MSEFAFGDWFGSFATQAAAKRYLTMNWTGPRVCDGAHWAGEVCFAEGRWVVRIRQL